MARHASDTSGEHGVNGGRATSRRAYLASAGAASVAAFAGCAGFGGGTTTISVLTWEDFEDMMGNIEDTLDVEIEMEASTSSSSMFSRWNQGADEQFDIAVPNNNLVPRFLDSDLIAPVDRDAVSNYEDVYEKFRGLAEGQFSQGGDEYGVPIRFGWYGYAYDTREVPDHDPSYSILFEEDYVDVDLDGEIIMYDEDNKSMPVAALYLAEARDDPSFREALTENDRMTFSSEQIDEMRDLLIDQQPRLEGYISSDPTFIQEFVQGNFLVGHSGRNEVMRMRDEHDVDWPEFVVPQEGAMAWYETAVVSQQSDNVETAWEVVNEFVAPENGASLARSGYSPSCNPEVAQQLDDEENELFGNIDPDRLDEMVPFKAIANDAEDEYKAAWDEVKS